MDAYLICFSKTKGGPSHYVVVMGRSAIEARTAFMRDGHQVSEIRSVWREVGGWNGYRSPLVQGSQEA